MKPIVATGLSLAGVLGAGALAAVANMQVLDGPEDITPVASAAQPAAVGAPAGGGGNGDTTGAVGVQTFQVGSAGTITLDASGGLHLIDSDPAPGWRAEQEDAPSGEVVVTFEAEGDGDLTATALLAADGIHVTVAGEAEDDEPSDDVSGQGVSGRDHAEDDEIVDDD
jgi:hypothetical protein